MIESGQCYCGAVRYEVSGEAFNQTLCHCADCRRASGAPCVAWFTVQVARFRITLGRAREFRSSPSVTRSFCPQCGTQLTYRRDDQPDSIDITTCSLDHPDRAAPVDHTFTHSRLGWIKLADGLPQFERTRAEGQNE